MAKKTWIEKMNPEMTPEVKLLERPFGGFPVGAKLLIPTPSMVKEYIYSIPRGESRTAKEMRADLAAQNGADTTCPLCSGMFLRIVAEAANELGEPVPVWRMIAEKSPTRKKLSFDLSELDEKRVEEGLSA